MWEVREALLMTGFCQGREGPCRVLPTVFLPGLHCCSCLLDGPEGAEELWDWPLSAAQLSSHECSSLNQLAQSSIFYRSCHEAS